MILQAMNPIRLWPEARAYCGRSPAWELAKDPVLRLASFLYASKRCSSRSDQLLLLVRARAALLGLATISTIAAEVRISIT
jgi:hypothetical protein